ncbi:MAG: hypothetical protein OXN84_09290 [Albidovulum sp.]|nr:hypothetical protein [Albidovulum sp.]
MKGKTINGDQQDRNFEGLQKLAFAMSDFGEVGIDHVYLGPSELDPSHSLLLLLGLENACTPLRFSLSIEAGEYLRACLSEGLEGGEWNPREPWQREYDE